MKRNICTGCMITVVILAVAGWFLLPSTVIVQINASGRASHTMPKLLAVLFPLAVTFYGGIHGIMAEDDAEQKSTLMAVIGVLAMLLVILFNM